MALRGIDAAAQAKQAATSRQAGGGRSHMRVQAESDVPFLVRFRGLMELPPLVYTESELQKFTTEDLESLLADLAGGLRARDKEERPKDVREFLVAAILRRYQIEPYVTARHYVERNKNRGKVAPVMTCGDPEAAILGNIRQRTSCLICKARLAGDEGIGWPQTQHVFSVWDYRKVHAVAGSGKTEYVECTIDEDDECKHCERNAKILRRHSMTEDEVAALSKEQRESWVKQSGGYAPRYSNGLRQFPLAGRYAGLVMDLHTRLSKRCLCGTPKLRAEQAVCPHCDNTYDLALLKESGWRPAAGLAVQCPECEKDAPPFLVHTCKNPRCKDPKPTRLCDVVVRCLRTGSGASTNWSFNEVQGSEPLDPDDAEDARILGEPLPNYDIELGPPDEKDQAAFIGSPPGARGAHAVGVLSRSSSGFSRHRDDDDDDGNKGGKASKGGKGGKR